MDRQDAASLQRLFAHGTAGFGYAQRYFTEFFAVPATGLRLTLETRTTNHDRQRRGEVGHEVQVAVQRHGVDQLVGDLCDTRFHGGEPPTGEDT
ncbi:hypothetical protein AB0N88_20570 [Streptomyces sp. NPDC093516]|uniref:hypothetical protein n=1 Tax=Streptomyces sp. NPDC093516 TaxID=3155304 RepID=UPI0034141BC8